MASGHNEIAAAYVLRQNQSVLRGHGPPLDNYSSYTAESPALMPARRCLIPHDIDTPTAAASHSVFGGDNWQRPQIEIDQDLWHFLPPR